MFFKTNAVIWSSHPAVRLNTVFGGGGGHSFHAVESEEAGLTLQDRRWAQCWGPKSNRCHWLCWYPELSPDSPETTTANCIQKSHNLTDFKPFLHLETDVSEKLHQVIFILFSSVFNVIMWWNFCYITSAQILWLFEVHYNTTGEAATHNMWMKRSNNII